MTRTLQASGSRRRFANVQVLPSASNVVITGSSFIGVQQKYKTEEISGQNNSLQPLYDRVASNAILNAGGRADEVRCHPGTREEVMKIIKKWIDSNGDQSRCIFWLSGPAGAGKTAIIQTVAERYIQRKAPMANFFFFRTDSTRNHAGPLVATLLYQILELYPAMKAKITTLLDTKPLIFDQSIRDQFKYLIDIPVRAVFDDSAHTTHLVLLIDGLDECNPDAKHVQVDLLHALHHLSTQEGSPFLVLVASRAEPHLVMAFNDIGSSNDSIFLDDNYHPSDNIRIFVVAEFDRIKRTHHLRKTLDSDWPSKASIDEIVQKSSGQFIYAATVMRFIASSSASPAHSLDKVRGIRPIVKSSPFAELDAIYTYIFSRVEDWDSAKDILAGQFLLPAVRQSHPMIYHRCTTCKLLAPLGLTKSDIESSLADAVAVAQFNRESQDVIFYHASLQDFLRDESRSKALHIDLDVFAAKLAAAHISAISTFYGVELFCSIFSLVRTSCPPLREALIFWKPPKPETLRNRQVGWESRMGIFGCQCIAALQRLYEHEDYLFYQTMLQKWLTWLSDLKIPMKDTLDNNPEASKIWDGIQQGCSGGKALPRVAFWKRLLRV